MCEELNRQGAKEAKGPPLLAVGGPVGEGNPGWVAVIRLRRFAVV